MSIGVAVLKLRYALFAFAALVLSCAHALAQTSNVASLADFRSNAYGGTVWLEGNILPGDGGQGYFLPNGKQSVTHCVDDGKAVVVDKNGTCWDRQNGGAGGSPVSVIATVTDLQNEGALCPIIEAAWVPGVGHFSWNALSTATPSDQVIQCTGVTTGRMIIDPGPLALASITAMTALPGPINNTTVYVAGLQAGWFIFNSSSTCTTNTGTCFAATDGTPGKWERQYNGPLQATMFGADPTGANPSATAFNNCIAVSSCYGTDGTYDADTTIIVGAGQSLTLSPGATLHRLSTGPTTPVLECVHTNATCSGGIVQDDADSPNGAVVGGATSNSDNTNAEWWSISNMTIKAQTNAGDIALALWSGQYTYPSTASSYLWHVHNLNIHGGDIGVLLADYVNAGVIIDINFWQQVSCAYKLQGAYGNTIFGGFIHTHWSAGLVGLCMSAPTAPSTNYTTKNTIIGVSDESGSGDPLFNFDATAAQNTLVVNQNTGTIGTYSPTTGSNLVTINGQFYDIPNSTGNGAIVRATNPAFTNGGTAGNAASWGGSTYGGYLYSGGSYSCVTSGTGCTGAGFSFGSTAVNMQSQDGGTNLQVKNGGLYLPLNIPTSAPATHCALWDNAGVVNITTCP